ncbi:MAG: helix-turn-helix transcriptional regulator [Clostridia bacterium]|nr:helix-turn-helix transcriptional regulator [Clostridia bacterium]
MQNGSIYTDIAGCTVVPDGWYIRDRIKKQRLYYIFGGTGSMSDAVGNRIPLERGKIYIHPYNLAAEYESSPSDPIDHLFFDFITTPPLISNAPIIYEVPANSSVMYTLKAAQTVFSEMGKSMLHVGGNTVSPRTDGYDGYRHILHALLSLLLEELNNIRALPYSSDTAVCAALETIRRGYAAPLTVTELASAAGFEVNYFIRRFRSVMGVTPYAYLRSYRLLKARELIAGGMTLAHAADAVGYENASSLSRAMKQKVHPGACPWMH